MCPYNCFLLILIGFVFLILIAAWRSAYRKINSNFERISKILGQAELRSDFWRGSRIIEGYYKDRKVRWAFYPLDKHQRTDISMEPHGGPKKQNFFLLRYPKPTDRTQLRGGMVRYSGRTWFRDPLSSGIKDFTEAEVTEILEELARASEIVETSSRFD